MDFPEKEMAITTILVVSDIEKSKNWYTNVLGASMYREYGGSSVVLQFLEHWLLIVSEGEPTADKPDVYFSRPDNPNRVSHAFTIRVKDCQKSYEELKDRGAEFISPPYDHGYEIRCFFRDPDGHLFEISQA